MTPRCPTPLLDARDQRVPLWATATLRERERQCQDLPLMQRAGWAVARLALALWPHAQRIAVVCGPGNNGGDGRLAAHHLMAWGRSVQWIQVGAARTPGPELPAEPWQALDPAADVVVDALLGLGLVEAPRGDWAHAINAMNAHPAPKLAVDLPSGLMAETGLAPGAIVRCQATLSLLGASPGLVTGAGRDHAGALWGDDLGVPGTTTPFATAGAPLAEWRAFDPRALAPHATHKGTAGRVWVLEGESNMAGAAALAARAAHAAGAGRVYRVGATTAREAAGDWAELMRAFTDQALDEVGRGVAVVGCGGGASMGSSLAPWLERAGHLVLDADGLNAVAGEPRLRAAVRQRAQRGQVTAITPHPLEAARLLGTSVDAVQANRWRAAQDLAEDLRCTVVLKGSGTVIAAPGALPHANTSGHAALAMAGTGDVLAGWLGGLMAQAPTAATSQLAAIACAWHGLAAEAASPDARPLRASALIDHMAALRP